MQAQAQAQACVNDDTGVRVCVVNPKRVLSLSPHLTETVAFVGGLNRLRAVDDSSDYPAEVSRIKKLPTPWLLGVEAVLAEKPDLVLVWKSGFSLKTVDQLRLAGVPVFVSEPRTLADVVSGQQRIATLLGLGKSAHQSLLQWEHGIETLRKTHAGRVPVTVFYQVWHQPLMTLGGGHVVNEVIQLCGGRNVFGHVQSLSFTVNLEAVLAKRPQLILSSGKADAQARLVDQWASWSSLPAVQRKNLLVFQPDILVRNGPRLLEAARQMCTMLDLVRSQNQSPPFN